MNIPPLKLLTVAFSALLSSHCFAADPVTRVPVYVLPYYESASSPSASPMVAVAKEYNELLASPNPSAILRVRDMIAAKNELITPATLMVLAIRLYDVGLRDEAVFWFYVAKDRHSTVEGVLDVGSRALKEVATANRAFATVAGPTINGYAFCNVDRQQATRARAFQWVVDHPYQALFIPSLPAKPGDRRENLSRHLDQRKLDLAKEKETISNADFRLNFTQHRTASGVNAMYCWK